MNILIKNPYTAVYITNFYSQEPDDLKLKVKEYSFKYGEELNRLYIELYSNLEDEFSIYNQTVLHVVNNRLEILSI